MAPKKGGLGKGLGALFAEYEEEYANAVDTTVNASDKPANELIKTSQPTASARTPIEVERNKVFPNPDQPRKTFDGDALTELANSIKLHGIISPLVVVERNDGYMIIAGERRWRAADLAGLKTVPVVIKEYTEQKIKEISLIENLQREDLNPIEAAYAIKQLMNEFNFTQETVADRLGKSRPAIANTLRLLTLTPEVIDLIVKSKLSAGHARCLVVVRNEEDQLKFAKAACDNKITVRDLEKMIKEYFEPKQAKKPKQEQSLELKDLVSTMQRVFATKVTAIGNDNKGRIYIDYYSRDDLDRILEHIETLKK